VSRYIHLNPVRARMVRRPEEWPWSSYPGYQRARRALAWVTCDAVLGEFACDAGAARRAYGRFVASGVTKRPKSPFARAVGGLLVGSDAFAARIGKLLADRPHDPELPVLRQLRARPSLDHIISIVCVHFGCERSDWQPGRRVNDAGRAVAAYLARRRFGYAAGEIARALGYRGHSSVGTAVKRVESGTAELKKAAAELERSLR